MRNHKATLLRQKPSFTFVMMSIFRCHQHFLVMKSSRFGKNRGSEQISSWTKSPLKTNEPISERYFITISENLTLILQSLVIFCWCHHIFSTLIAKLIAHHMTSRDITMLDFHHLSDFVSLVKNVSQSKLEVNWMMFWQVLTLNVFSAIKGINKFYQKSEKIASNKNVFFELFKKYGRGVTFLSCSCTFSRAFYCNTCWQSWKFAKMHFSKLSSTNDMWLYNNTIFKKLDTPGNSESKYCCVFNNLSCLWEVALITTDALL